ncbi:MAG TPA: hypothetical protein VFB60_08675 [Ktedonobacteraceae bacterium]|nr:hypothetical protein [Ktedonobacteraceae bacterium]
MPRSVGAFLAARLSAASRESGVGGRNCKISLAVALSLPASSWERWNAERFKGATGSRRPLKGKYTIESENVKRKCS